MTYKNDVISLSARMLMTSRIDCGNEIVNSVYT